MKIRNYNSNKMKLPGFTASSALYKVTQTHRQISNTFTNDSRSLLALQLPPGGVGGGASSKECCCTANGQPNLQICDSIDCDDCCSFSCYCGGPTGDSPDPVCRCPWWCEGLVGGPIIIA
jgi:hypothetical protein